VTLTAAKHLRGLLGAALIALLSVRLVLIAEQFAMAQGLYGDALWAAAAGVMVVFGLGVGVLGMALTRSAGYLALSLAASSVSFLILAAGARQRVFSALGEGILADLAGTDLRIVSEVFGSPYAYVTVALGLVLFSVAAVTSAALFTLLRGGGSWGWSWRLARAFLSSKRREQTVSVISVITLLGVALGVTAMIVVLSVMSGFATDLKAKILGSNPHLVVMKYGTTFDRWQPIQKKVAEQEHVLSAVPFLYTEVMVTSPTGMSGAMVRGIRPGDAAHLGALRDSIVSGDMRYLSAPQEIPDPMAKYRAMIRQELGLPEPGNKTKEPANPDQDLDDFLDDPTGTAAADTEQPAVLPAVVIGAELAKMLHAEVGQEIQVVSPLGELGPTGPIPKARTYRVGAIFKTGFYEYDAKFVYVTLPEAQAFLDQPGAISGLEVRVDDVEAVDRVRTSLRAELGGAPFYTRNWREANKPLFQALLLEKIVMFIILCAVVLVASLNIISTLVMVVLERGKEIAILKSLGATDTGVMRIFVLYGLVVGVAGTLLGAALGVGICFLIETYGVNLDSSIYYIDRLPVDMRWSEVGTVLGASLVLCFLAGLYPAWHAARLQPVEGLRHD
jgi:lipoprotein-releasing system permease protein